MNQIRQWWSYIKFRTYAPLIMSAVAHTRNIDDVQKIRSIQIGLLKVIFQFHHVVNCLCSCDRALDLHFLMPVLGWCYMLPALQGFEWC